MRANEKLVEKIKREKFAKRERVYVKEGERERERER